MRLTDEQLDSMLSSQRWIEPSADFTHNVMQRISVERAMQAAPAIETRRARWTERLLTATPIAATFGVLGYHSRTLGTFALEYLRDIGMWLNATTGLSLFGSYPVLILGVVAPLMAGAVASCALSGRCKLTSA
jgi:hypothetical protein